MGTKASCLQEKALITLSICKAYVLAGKKKGVSNCVTAPCPL